MVRTASSCSILFLYANCKGSSESSTALQNHWSQGHRAKNTNPLGDLFFATGAIVDRFHSLGTFCCSKEHINMKWKIKHSWFAHYFRRWTEILSGPGLVLVWVWWSMCSARYMSSSSCVEWWRFSVLSVPDVPQNHLYKILDRKH